MPDVPVIGSDNPTPGQSTVQQLMGISGITTPIPIPQQTVQTHQYNPRIPQPSQSRQDQPTNRQPITGSVADIKRARRQNAIGGVVNALNQFGRMTEQKHIESVTHDVTTVMQAQQQIDNAQAVINNPNSSEQDKKNANGVLASNKGLVERIFSDPKRGKNLKKAFDISFTDPEKNNTPEVKAMQAAKKKFDAAKAAGLDYDSPEEKKIGELANNPQGRRSLTGPNPNQSTTPHADQFARQQIQSLSENPAYTSAMKQREDQEKAAQKLLPTVIKEDGVNTRTQYTQQQLNARAEQLRITQVQNTLTRAAAGIKEANIRASATVQSVKLHIASNERIATQRVTSNDTAKKAIDTNVKLYGNLMQQAGRTIQTYQAQIEKIKTDPLLKTQEEKDQAIDTIINTPGGLKDWQNNYKEYQQARDAAQVQLGALRVGGNDGGITGTTGSNPFDEILGRDEKQRELIFGPEKTNGNSIGDDNEDPDSDEATQYLN